MDSRAIFHSCPNSEITDNYIFGNLGKLYLANDEHLKIIGKGDVRIKIANKYAWLSRSIRLIPGLKRNMILIE